jgi:predicted metallopeptidase
MVLFEETPMERPISKRSDPGLDFTAHVRRLANDLTTRLDELAHIDMARVAIRFCQARGRGLHGVQASLTPLRFADGSLETTLRGKRYAIERLYDASGREMLYLLSFYLPRFLDHSFDEKLATICHELWHIGPRFDGDLRRHEGRCYAHGPSERQYHTAMRQMAERWLALAPPRETYQFLQSSFRELVARHGRVFGTRITTPKLIPLPARAA